MSDQDTALIVYPIVGNRTSVALDERLQEAEGLAHAIFLDVIEIKTVKLSKPVAGYLFSKGHRKDIANLVSDVRPDIVIVDHTLSPVQQRNLEKEWNAKVIDRTGLILEIFGARAQTSEGKIQVELAALEYQRSRLVKSWTHLERQRGSTSFIGGPGETQLEVDRRIITDRLAKLRKDLQHVRKTREIQKRSREKEPFPIVALVGYTNAGKSTLFNRLTGAGVYAEDLPFATLDPTMRKLTLENGQDIILSDTVGFIADLPTHLVASFRATLEEVQDADIILHVRDLSRVDYKTQKQDVIKVLADLGIKYEEDQRIVEVYNKIDALNADDQADILRKASFQERSVVVSALTGQGIDGLLVTIEEQLAKKRCLAVFDIDIGDGEALAWLHQNSNILTQENSETTIRITTDLNPANLGRFKERFSYQELTTGNDELAYASKH